MIHIDSGRLEKDVAALLDKQDILTRWRGVHFYMGKIRSEVGDGVLDACKEIIEENTRLLFDDCSDVLALGEDYGAYLDDPRSGQFTRAYVVIWLWFNYYREIKEFEKLAATGDREKMWEGLREPKDPKEHNKPGFVPTIPTIKWFWKVVYRGFLYRLCMKMDECLTKKARVLSHHRHTVELFDGVDRLEDGDEIYYSDEIELPYLVRYLKMVYIYTALRNERERIRDEAIVQGVALPVMDEMDVTAPAAVAPTSSPRPAVNEKKKKDSILTDRAVKYFEKAIGAGMMVKDGGCYRWKYNGGSNISLAYFLKRIYNDDGCGATPFKKLEELFSVRNLAQSTNSLLNSRNEPKWQARLDELFDDD